MNRRYTIAALALGTLFGLVGFWFTIGRRAVTEEPEAGVVTAEVIES